MHWKRYRGGKSREIRFEMINMLLNKCITIGCSNKIKSSTYLKLKEFEKNYFHLNNFKSTAFVGK